MCFSSISLSWMSFFSTSSPGTETCNNSEIRFKRRLSARICSSMSQLCRTASSPSSAMLLSGSGADQLATNSDASLSSIADAIYTPRMADISLDKKRSILQKNNDLTSCNLLLSHRPLYNEGLRGFLSNKLITLQKLFYFSVMYVMAIKWSVETFCQQILLARPSSKLQKSTKMIKWALLNGYAIIGWVRWSRTRAHASL